MPSSKHPDALDELLRALLVPSLDPQQELGLLRAAIEILGAAVSGDERTRATDQLRALLEPTAKLPLPGTPVVALRDIVVFPATLEHAALTSSTLFVGRPVSLAAIEAALVHREPVLLVALRERDADPSPATLHEVGTLARITSAMRLADDSLRIAFSRERRRARIAGYALESPYLCARVTDAPLPAATSRAAELLPALRGALEAIATTGPLHLRDVATRIVERFGDLDPEAAADTVAELGPRLSPADRQALLELPTVEARLEQLVARLSAT